MNTRLLLGFALLATPSLTYAASLQDFFKNLLTVINNTIIPFLLGIAFLLFVINAIRFFVFNGASDDGRENARNLALYSVFAFVIIVAFWGIINLLTTSTGLQGETAPTPDYIETKNNASRAP